MLKFHSLPVVRLMPDAEDAVAIELAVPPELRAEYLGAAGQHVVVRVSLDGEETRRTYSLVNAPGEWPLRIVPRVHALGRMSRYLAEQLRPGDELEVLPPNGSFTPRDAAAAGGTFVAFAAGCGITPVLSVIRTLLSHPGPRVILFYGNSASARTMCLEELLALKDRHLGRLSLHFVMSREPQEVALYNGRIDAPRVRQFAALFRAPEVREYFVCGPGDMIEQVTATLRELGVDSARVHAEHFTVATTEAAAAGEAAAPGVPAGLPPASSPAPAGTAEVTVLMDGRRRSFTMRMDDETVLD